MNAKEAKKLAEESKLALDNLEYERVMEAIQDSALSGNSICKLSYLLSKTTIAQLKVLGYKVEGWVLPYNSGNQTIIEY